MTLPRLSDLRTYSGRQFTSSDWDFNCQRFIDFVASGNYDATFGTVTATSFVGNLSGCTGFPSFDLSLTAGEDISIGDCVRVGTSGNVYKATNASAAGISHVIGIATNSALSGASVTVTRFVYTGFTGLSPNSVYYVGTSGAITSSVPASNIKPIGYATSSTTLVLDKNTQFDATQSQVNIYPNIIAAGTFSLTGDFAVNTNKFNVSASTGNTTVSGTLGAIGDFSINTNKFNVSASTGNTTVAGTMGVTGLTTVTGIKKAVVTKTTTYTATTSDHTILCSGSAFTINLPACSGNTGLELVITKTDSSLTNIITIDPNGAETVNGAATTTLNTQYESVTLICDGTSNWVIDNRVIPEYTVTGTNTIGATTTNPTKGTPITDRLWGRRSGKFWEFQIMFEQAPVGTVGSGDYLFTVVPSGVVINTSDSSVYPITVPGDVENSYVIPFGSAFVDSIGVSAIFASPILYDTSKIRLLSIGSYYVRNGYYDFAGRILYSVTGKVPISGWNS